MNPEQERELVSALFHEYTENCKEDCDYEYKSLMCRITSASDNCPHKMKLFNVNCPRTSLKENNHKTTLNELLNKDWELK